LHTNSEKIMKKFIALASILISATSVFAHGDAHPNPAGAKTNAPLAAEQTDWGIAGHPARVQRTITLRMLDTMRFEPAHITVKEGDTVRLRATNAGKVLHEIVLGTPAVLAAHAELMKKHPNMEHDEPHMAHVPAGQRGDIVWTFNRPGTVAFACLLPGHFEAGMSGTITVLPRASAPAKPTAAATATRPQ
jgi:uncharacterized cupredoxin-like copper-binding protein